MPENGKARLPILERLNVGTANWLEEVDWSFCWDGTSVTRVKYDDRYAVQSLLGHDSEQKSSLDPCDTGNYRPISSSLFVSKLLQSCVNVQLTA